jgi:GT2 family glycosyltransferase
MGNRLKLACVFLHREKADPEELRRAVDKVLDQLGDPIEVLVVSQGVPTPKLPDPVRVVELPDNLGIIGGRNAGLDALRESGGADVVLFLDSDGWLASPTTGELLRERFAAEPELGIVSFRIEDADTGIIQRRHVPRLRVGDPKVSSEVTTFLGGANAIRMAVLDQVGSFPEAFFYGHEETDLAWRALDAGWRIRYDAECVMYHPLTLPTKHAVYYRMNARNRVWLAKRNLPWPLAVAYLGTWILLTVLRVRGRNGLAVWWSGFVEGVRSPAGERHPMRWRTVWRMTKLGRPPLV